MRTEKRLCFCVDDRAASRTAAARAFLVKSMHRLARVAFKQACSDASLTSLCWAQHRAPGKRQRTRGLDQFVLAFLLIGSKTLNERASVHHRESDLFLAARHRFSTVASRRLARLIGVPSGTLPRNRLAASATGGASAVSSDKSEKMGSKPVSPCRREQRCSRRSAKHPNSIIMCDTKKRPARLGRPP